MAGRGSHSEYQRAVDAQEISRTRQAHHSMQPPEEHAMKKQHSTAKLEDIPNIGKSIAADLCALGIHTPQQLATREPLDT